MTTPVFGNGRHEGGWSEPGQKNEVAGPAAEVAVVIEQCGGASGLACDVRVRRAAFAFVVTCPPKGSEPSHAESTGCGAGWTNHTLALPDSRRTFKLGAS